MVSMATVRVPATMAVMSIIGLLHPFFAFLSYPDFLDRCKPFPKIFFHSLLLTIPILLD